MNPLVLVQLFDEKTPGNGGLVLAVGFQSRVEILGQYLDRDGCSPSNLRVWRGYSEVKPGDRVQLSDECL